MAALRLRGSKSEPKETMNEEEASDALSMIEIAGEVMERVGERAPCGSAASGSPDDEATRDTPPERRHSPDARCPECAMPLTEMGTTVEYRFCDRCGFYEAPASERSERQANDQSHRPAE